MLLVTFAVPHESRSFRRTTAARGVRVVHTGIGEAAARQALQEALAAERPEAVISSGFAGGLASELQAGDLVADSSASSPDLLAILPTTVRRGRILTASKPVDSPEEKNRLRRETGALAVDMETEAIASECARAGIPLLVLRIISDAADDSIPVPLEVAWDIQRQKPRPIRLMAYLASHPRQISPFLTFLRQTNKAAGALARILANLALIEPAQHCQ